MEYGVFISAAKGIKIQAHFLIKYREKNQNTLPHNPP